MYVSGMGNNILDLFTAIHDTLVAVGWTVYPMTD